ncbi:hypothetical protein K4L44_14215 [Halosquirtibacter laminarini]|uniref:Uncharacterized protein n=1 Tax=Halosquirtibacter laminarini TaxID=3374600 RepID=A0AC61NDS1_9BACT|nr:hypothetical protein K4L44_14215 [Prolixibacteraceae bacterium]
MRNIDIPKLLLFILIFFIFGSIVFSIVVSYILIASLDLFHINIVETTSAFMDSMIEKWGNLGRYAAIASIVIYYFVFAKWGYRLYRYFDNK